MSSAVKLSDELLSHARVYAKTFHRSIAGQIEYWAKIGQMIEENPELSYQFIQGILLSLEEVKQGKIEPYAFQDKNDQ